LQGLHEPIGQCVGVGALDVSEPYHLQ
jgi:hypothetical protein